MSNNKNSFTLRVYSMVKKIPKGKVATYGQIARLVGNPRATRAVGLCMKHNPYSPIVPCHRVVGSNGQLTGYSGKGGIKEKRNMLKKERVSFINNQVDLQISQWSI